MDEGHVFSRRVVAEEDLVQIGEAALCGSVLEEALQVLFLRITKPELPKFEMSKHNGLVPNFESRFKKHIRDTHPLYLELGRISKEASRLMRARNSIVHISIGSARQYEHHTRDAGRTSAELKADTKAMCIDANKLCVKIYAVAAFISVMGNDAVGNERDCLDIEDLSKGMELLRHFAGDQLGGWFDDY